MANENTINILLQRHLRLRHLVLLTSIAEQGTLLKAASQLNLTQSAITKSLRELESTLEIELFTRTPRGVTPTVFGRSLINHAKAILGEVGNAAEELNELKTGTSGHVTIGALRAAAPALLPRAIADFQAQHAKVTVTVQEGLFSALNPALRTGEIDFLVGYLSEFFRPRQGFTQETLYNDTVAIAVRKGHPVLKQKKRLTLAGLMDDVWILPLPDTVFRRYVDSGLRAAGLDTPARHIESITTSLIQALLWESDMVAALPRQMAQQFEKYGLISILPIRFDNIGLPVGITMRSDSTISQAAKMLLNCLRRVAQEETKKS